MKLMRIGERYINLDLVTDIRAGESSVRFYFADSEEGKRHVESFNDPEQAKAITQWLVKNSEDPMKQPSIQAFNT